MENKTQWIKLENFTNYEINENGVVRNSKTKRIRKTFIEKNGYERITLSENGNVSSHLVHRLVANAFLEKTEGKIEVNHLDKNKLNNHYSNLEWCTAKENIQHSLSDRKQVIRKRLTRKQVLKVLELSKKGISQYKIANLYGVTQICVGYILSGKTYRSITGL